MTDIRFLAGVHLPLRRLGAVALLAAPYAVAVTYAVLGYYRLAGGVAPAADYHAHAYATLSYSDILWVYLRDGVGLHPLPYFAYPLEYPVLLGALIYLTSFAAGPLGYFTLNYVLLAGAALATVALLERIPGADPWRFALVPTLYFYTGLNWDLGAIFLMTAALVAFIERRDLLGALLLAAAVWFKFFPLVLLPAILLQRYREGRRREVLLVLGVFGVATVLFNLPAALGNTANWLYFFTFNDERSGDSGIWAVVTWLSVDTVNRLSAVGLLVGGAALAAASWRWRGNAAVVGALFLLLWLLVNKVFSPQYSLYVFLAAALLRVPWPAWVAMAAIDLSGYLYSFLILHTLEVIPQQPGPMLNWELVNLRTPFEVAREVAIVFFILYGVLVLAHRARAAVSEGKRPA